MQLQAYSILGDICLQFYLLKAYKNVLVTAADDGSVSGTWACRADCPVVQRDVDKYSDQTCFFIRETTGRLRRRHAAVN